MRIALLSRSTLFTQPGGDTVQLKRNAEELQRLGVEAVYVPAGSPPPFQPDVVHFYNLGRPADYFKTPGISGIPLVISSIYARYAEADQRRPGLKGFFSRFVSASGAEYYKTAARWIRGTETFPGWSYLGLGQRKSTQRLLNNARLLVATSAGEIERIAGEFARLPEARVVPPGVDRLPVASTKPRKGVICVARIEQLKNQLNLIRALHGTDIPLTLVGAPAVHQPDYVQACRNLAGPNVRFTGALSREEVWKLLSEHAVHALPSYYETFGLSHLEAAFAGCHLVFGRTDAENELTPYGLSCDPDQPESIRQAINNALERVAKGPGETPDAAYYSWENAARLLKSCYETACV